MSMQRKLLISVLLFFITFMTMAQSGIKVNDGAFLKAGTGTYIKISGAGSSLIIDTNSVLESSSQISIEGDFLSHGTVNLSTGLIELQGNWTNKGVFDAGLLLVKFSGSNSQIVYHSGNSFYDMEIDKTADSVFLDSNIEVSHQVEFTNGMLDSGDDTLILGITANLLNERDGNYAMGFVQIERLVNNSVENFGQIGAELDATSNNQNLGLVTVTRSAGLVKVDTSYINSPDNTAKKSIDRIWNFSPQTVPSDSIDLSFSWIQENDNGNTDRDSMYVYINSSPLLWDTLGTVQDATSRSITAQTLDLSSFTVASQMIFPFEAKLSADTVCFGSSTSFTDSSIVWGTGVSYSWDFDNDGIIDNTTSGNVSFNYSAAGIYTAKLKISNNEGAKDSITVQVLIADLPIATFEADSVCAGSATSFTDLSTADPGMSYAWDFDADNTVDNTTTGSVSTIYPAGDNYEAVLTIASGYCIDRDTVNVIVYDLPTVNAGSDKEISEGSSVTPQLTTTGIIQSYAWSPSSFLDDVASASPVATPSSDITYTVTVTTDKGCSAFDDISIHILKDIFIPTGFTPDGDGVNDTWEIPDLASFPEATIVVFDRAGQKVFEGDSGRFWDGTYNGKDSPTGTYYFIITPGEGKEKVSGSLTLIRLRK